jgi:hypothetical protein
MPNLIQHLGDHLGARDAAHLARWRVALAAGLAKQQCVATSRRSGQPCRGTPLKYSDKCRCHCLGAERIEVDARRLPWLQRQLRRTGNADARTNIELRIARIERRRLRWAWRRNPFVPGKTIDLAPRDEERVRAWLRETTRVDDPDALSPRCYDRLSWAAALCLSMRTTAGTAVRSVRTALRDEGRWLARTATSPRASL